MLLAINLTIPIRGRRAKKSVLCCSSVLLVGAVHPVYHPLLHSLKVPLHLHQVHLQLHQHIFDFSLHLDHLRPGRLHATLLVRPGSPQYMRTV